ncbi:MAG: hypothetical protein IJ171_04305, partial [Ruminococcus sp.]|nr:hypothetical protein [Ruminococcus sp.]
MKTVKRFFAIAIAVLMLAMMIPAVSAAGSNTVNWTCAYPGYTYTVYTVATYNTATGNYDATVASLKDAVNAAVTQDEVAALAVQLKDNTDLPAEGTTFTTDAGSDSFTLGNGVYFIKCTQ